MLINPFTIIKIINAAPSFETSTILYSMRVLLAFSKCSKEFVFVVLCTQTNYLRVYQSRNCGWVTFSSKIGNQEWVVHFVVLHNVIYLVTNKANIGVLSLNSPNIKFLKLKSTPNVTNINFKLVNCDEQLLVVDSRCHQIRNVYKIDFSTMSYVKLETLGDMALFCNVRTTKTDCYALNNPNRWGYESNSVYVTTESTTMCKVYSADDKKLQKYIKLPTLGKSNHYIYDWCFKHLLHEIDYSLVG
ncbi:uncharacterized protein LOC123918196 [Trifolium pratense]|uniref:uncharacterized protein LOC123918196 n=1 Tax=Trifolium pratense TaxID=57577 RepID=UPI001E698205|nr:uncharacterized protein LOC123918196 [Trifolium pratense]